MLGAFHEQLSRGYINGVKWLRKKCSRVHTASESSTLADRLIECWLKLFVLPFACSYFVGSRPALPVAWGIYFAQGRSRALFDFDLCDFGFFML